MHRTAFALMAIGLTACTAQPPAPAGAPVSGATETARESEASSAPARADTVSSDASAPEPAPQGDAIGEDTSDEPLAPEFDGPRIPARFHGVYAREGACGRAGDESRLSLTFERAEFHESSGAVRRATGSADALDVVVRLSGEGETREATYRYRLDGDRLVDRDGGMVRVRCAQKAV